MDCDQFYEFTEKVQQYGTTKEDDVLQ